MNLFENSMRLVVLAVFILSRLAHAGLPDQQQFINSAIIEAEGKLTGKHSFFIRMELAKFQPGGKTKEISFYGGDSKTFQPDVIVSGLKLSIDGKDIVIPVGLLEDLGDPYWCVPEIASVNGAIYVTISGGNAGWSDYTAKIKIVKGKIIQREVSNRMATLNLNAKPDVRKFK